MVVPSLVCSKVYGTTETLTRARKLKDDRYKGELELFQHADHCHYHRFTVSD